MNRLLAVVSLVLAGWLLPGVASAKVKCDVVSSSAMDFGRPGWPVGPVSTTSQVTVDCGGNKKEEGTQVLVCLGVLTSSRRMQPQTTGGPVALAYDIYRDPGHRESMDFTVNASALLRIGPDGASVTETFVLYGQLAAPQYWLAPDRYSQRVDAAMGFSTAPGVTCDSVFVDEEFQFEARAELYGSCSVTAQDLQFGTSSDLTLGPIDAQTSVEVACTPGTLYRVKLNGGSSGDIAGRRMSSAGGTIDYQLYLDGSYTQVWGDGQIGGVARGQGSGIGVPYPHRVYGRVPAQPTPAVGTYRDTVVVTVEY